MSYPEYDALFEGLNVNDLFETANHKDIQAPMYQIEEEKPLETCSEDPLKVKPADQESTFTGSTNASDSPAQDLRDVSTDEEREGKAESKILQKKISKALKSKKAVKAISNPGSARKRAQNKMKNVPGFLTAKLKKCCEERSRLFKVATSHLSEETREKFRAWMLNYNKDHKTWSKINEFIGMKKDFGVHFTNMATAFLSEGFEDGYGEFIKGGHLSDENKILMQEQSSKDLLTSKFYAMQDEFLGIGSGYKEKIRETRKALKSNKVSKESGAE